MLSFIVDGLFVSSVANRSKPLSFPSRWGVTNCGGTLLSTRQIPSTIQPTPDSRTADRPSFQLSKANRTTWGRAWRKTKNTRASNAIENTSTKEVWSQERGTGAEEKVTPLSWEQGDCHGSTGKPGCLLDSGRTFACQEVQWTNVSERGIRRGNRTVS